MNELSTMVRFYLNVTLTVAFFPMQCSTSCGPGHKTRSVGCVDAQGNKVDESLCKQKGRRRRPRSVKRCRKGQCPHWKAYKWTKVRVSFSHTQLSQTENQ